MFTVKDGAVPLGIAAQKGHTQTVQRLLEASARVNYQAKVSQFHHYTNLVELVSSHSRMFCTHDLMSTHSPKCILQYSAIAMLL